MAFLKREELKGAIKRMVKVLLEEFDNEIELTDDIKLKFNSFWDISDKENEFIKLSVDIDYTAKGLKYIATIKEEELFFSTNDTDNRIFNDITNALKHINNFLSWSNTREKIEFHIREIQKLRNYENEIIRECEAIDSKIHEIARDFD